jgi:hypothetical protein
MVSENSRRVIAFQAKNVVVFYYEGMTSWTSRLKPPPEV